EAGKGRGPEPFMLSAKAAAKADAVWHSNRAENAATRALGMSATARKQLSRAAKGSAAKASGTRGLSGRKASARAKRGPPARRASKLPEFVKPQLCRLVDRPPEGEGWGHEIKLDGYRLQLRIEGGEATLRTRKGLDWTDKFSSIAAAAGA